jgi:Phosphate-selective porin O and P
MRTSVLGLLLVAPMLFTTIASAQPAPPPPPPPGAAPAPPPPTATPAPVPPPVPPPWPTTPTSTSGTQLMPPTGSAATTESPVEARLADLEARVRAAEEAEERQREKLGWLSKFKIGGFVQPQLVNTWFNAAASPNVGTTGTLPAGIGANDVIAKADSTTTNAFLFRLRRARLKAEFEPTEYARAVFEIDPTLAGGAAGTGTIARNVEAIGIVPWCKSVKTEFGLGIFKVPFGFEILQSDADRPFIERSWGEQNMFPSEFDTGFRAYTTAFDKKLTVQTALVNGYMMGEKNFAVLSDLNHGKDVTGRINYNFGMFDVGVSGWYGQGQAVDATALKFKQFPRGAVNAEAALHHTFSKAIGATKLLGELTIGRNMDRGTKYAFGLPAIPADVINGALDDKDQRNLWLRVEQDVTHWATLGVRYDVYSPDTAQANDSRGTLSFVAAIHFTKALQWMVEFDHAIDNVHKAGGPVPSKEISMLSNVLQARF